MKIYENFVSDYGTEGLTATLPDGLILWIPKDPANSDYAEYLAYTAWVESGNEPEDFWTQSEAN